MSVMLVFFVVKKATKYHNGNELGTEAVELESIEGETQIDAFVKKHHKKISKKGGQLPAEYRLYR